MIVSLCVLSQ